MSNRFGSFPTPADIAAQVARLTDRDVYNWRSSKTQKVELSLAGALAGVGYSDHLFIGDGQTYRRNLSTWVNYLRDRMAAAGYPIAGSGWVRANDGTNNHDSRIAKTGTWSIPTSGNNSQPRGFSTSTQNGATLTFTSTLAGTTAGVLYLNTSAPFTVDIDGGTPVTVTPTGANSVGVYSVTGLSDATHAVRVTTTSTSEVQIAAFRVDKTTGVRFHNFAGFGWEAEGYFTSPNWNSPTNIIKTAVTPHVVHAAFGMGDVYFNRTYTEFAADLKLIRGYYPDSDFILYAGMEPDARNLSRHVRAMYDVADELECPLVDVFTGAGDYATANANGLMAGATYPSAKGHHRWARKAAKELIS